MHSDVSDFLKVGDFVTITNGLYAGMDGEVIEVVHKVTPWVGRARLRLACGVEDYWHPFWSDPMDEAEWLTTSNTAAMERWLEARRSVISDRKWRLLFCACVRRIWRYLNARMKRAITLSEKFADGTAVWEEVCRLAVELPVRTFYPEDLLMLRNPIDEPAGCAARFACMLNGDLTSLRFLLNGTANVNEADRERWFAKPEWHRDLLRDIFGNPFRLFFLDPKLLQWEHGAIVRMARDIYDSRHFDEMPILADALEDAGCTDPTILDHCRTPIHARGCWLLDAIIGLY